MTTTRSPRSNREQYVRAMNAFPVFLMVVGALFFAVYVGAGDAMNDMRSPEQGTEAMDLRPVTPGSPEALLAENGCWTGEAPADVTVPGHVVIRYEGETAAQYRGAKHVGIALEHLFGTPNPKVAEVSGFCR